MIELTPEQRQQLDQGRIVDVTDSETDTPYIVLRKDVFERVRAIVYDDRDATDDELRVMLARAAAGNGWDEPEMDTYDRYDEERRCP